VVTETTGTALVIGATTQQPDYNHPARAIIYRHVRAGYYLIIPICMTAGIVLKWFKDEFCKYEAAQCEKDGTSVYDLLGDLAASVPPLSEGLLLFPHFTGMLMPQRDLSAKGVFFGVGLDTKMPHFVRAIFEAVAYMLRENIELIEELGVDAKRILSLGGGSKSPVWLQIKADVLGKEIVNMENAEAASLGAAILGGVAVGLFGSLEEGFEIGNSIHRSFKPDPVVVQKYQKGFIRYKQLYEHVKPMFHEGGSKNVNLQEEHDAEV
jgi:xylulokinase